MKNLKSNIRKDYLEKRNKLKKDEILNLSDIICEKILNTNLYKQANSIFTYVNMKSEVQTINIIKKSINDKKIIAVPLIISKHNMVFIKINSVDELVKNKLGIYEPVFDKNKIVKSDNKSLIIVPGVVFAENGYRIGYGGGYYDKYLSENVYMKAIGVAYNMQITKSVPVNDYDIKLDFIVTEKGIF